MMTISLMMWTIMAAIPIMHNSPFEALGSFEYQNQVFLLSPI